MVCTAAEAKYSGGTGEPNNPYQIGTKADLLDLAADTNDYGKNFVLTADVNMEGQVFTTAIIAPDTSSNPNFQGTAFTGTFDGNGHKITNFTINSESNDYIGLFGRINAGGLLKNLSVENCSVSGHLYVGGLVGYSYYGSLIGCYATGSVTGTDYYTGGLCGRNIHGSITNCYATGSVTGVSYVGGLVGDNYYGSLTGCYATGSVNGANSYFVSCVGGLVGENWDGTLTACYATGSVTGTGACSRVGGLVGDNSSGNISNCYSTGAVSGTGCDVGGLVGDNGGSISNCYSTGTVSGTSSYVGGLVGENWNSITGCFWDTQTSGKDVGVGYGSAAGVSGKTTAEMKTLLIFTSAGWDFVEIWDIGENQTYPYLRTEPAGDLNHDKKVDFEDLAILALHWLEGTGPY